MSNPVAVHPQVDTEYMSLAQRDLVCAAALVLHTAHEYAEVYRGHSGADHVKRLALVTIKRARRRYGRETVDAIVAAARDSASQISRAHWSDLHIPDRVIFESFEDGDPFDY